MIIVSEIYSPYVLPKQVGLIFMDTVSQKFYIKLDKQISCEYICKQVGKIVTKSQQNGKDLSESFLVLEIRDISYGDSEPIPKLEFKN